MKCIVCHGEDIREQDVIEEIHVGTDIVSIPIRTLVCQQCGERYYDPPTMRYLDSVEEEVASGKIDLPEIGRILSYAMRKAA